MRTQAFCMMPFYFIEIFPSGDVYPCCPAYCNNYTFGNIFEQKFDDVWNGERAQIFRKTMFHRIHKYCNKYTCFKRSMDYLSNKFNIIPKIIMDTYPLVVKFSHDGECNYRCITCRDEILRHSESSLISLNNKIKTFLPLLKDAKIACLLGSGDPLSSRHSRQLIKIIAYEYPKIHFALHTNGSLCKPQLLDSLGISNRLAHIQISIHAACKQTYENFTREGKWENLLKNLDWIAKQHKDGHIRKFDMIFVVTPLNVNEMGSFAQLANTLGAQAFFWEYRWWGGKYGEDFKSVNILSKDHPLHNTLITQILNISSNDNVHISPAFIKLLRHSTIGFYKLLSKITHNWI